MHLRDIAEALSAEVVGDGAMPVRRLVHPADADESGDLALAMSQEACRALAGSRAEAAVVLKAGVPEQGRFKGIVVAADERKTLSVLTAMFATSPAHMSGIHPTAVIAPDARIAANAIVGACAVIGPRTSIGDGAIIQPHVTIGADVVVGADTLLHSGVRIGDRVRIGARVVIQSNAVIGADGFSFLPRPRTADGRNVVPSRIHSLGTVIIEDDVDIGAGTMIDRATIQATRIGKGTKIDNLVQIGHNVTIGESCLICGMSGISGSTKVGDRVRIGGGVGIADHLMIGADASIAAGSGLGTNVGDGTVMGGYPAMRADRYLEMIVFAGRAKGLHKKVETIDARIEAVEKALKDTRG